MPVNKVRRLGSFAPLSAQAWTDDALAEAGEAAELLYFRGLSFSAYVLRDGLVTESQLIRMVGHGMKDAKKRADRLCAVGLWVRVDNGYVVRSWLKWNRSKEEIEGLQRKDAGRKASPKPGPNGDDTPPGSESDRTPNGIQSDSDSDMLFDRNGFQPRARNTHTHTEPTPGTNSPSPRGSDFDRFYGEFPRHTGRKEAERKFAKAVKDGADPEAIIEGARRYAAERDGQDARFTKHPATWLHQGCWLDEPGLRLVPNGHHAYRNPTDPDAYTGELA